MLRIAKTAKRPTPVEEAPSLGLTKGGESPTAEGNLSTEPQGEAPNAEPCKSDVVASIRADDVQLGHILVLTDGLLAEVDEVRHGIRRFPDGNAHSVSIGWRSVYGNTSGLAMRRASDILVRRLGG